MSATPRVAIIEKHGGLLHWHHDLADGFRQCGAAVFPINLRASNWAEFLERRRSGCAPIDNSVIQARIAGELAACGPDLVVVLNRPGLPAAAATLWRDALKPGAAMVGWLCDHWINLPAGERPAFDGLYFFDSASRAGMEGEYAGTTARLALLPLAVNPGRFAASNIPAAARRSSLVFAGNCTPDRHDAIARVRAAGEPVSIYGPHAGNGVRFWRNRSYSSASLARLYGSYLASLNLLQFGNTRNALNLRAFEIPCAGGLGTFPEVLDLPGCFEPDREILVYRTLEEFPEIMARLRRDPSIADAIIAAGRKRVIAEHTYTHRAARMLSDFVR
jgi:spore maturation protein CgeB